MPQQWLQKHHPRIPSDIAGHSRTIRILREWLSEIQWCANGGEPGQRDGTTSTQPAARPPPITFLYGAGGIGKTTLARVLLHHSNYHIYELNSGEVRSKKRIEDILEKILNNHSVSMMKKKNRQQTLGIVMDEIDGMSCGDRGGLHELFHIVQKQFEAGVMVNPIICISNRPYDKKLPDTLYQEFQMRRPSESDIVQRLRTICDIEGVLVDDVTLMWITKYGKQDVRRTIHFLQEVVYCFGNVPGRELTIDDVNAVKHITKHTVADYNLFDITRTVLTRETDLEPLHDMYRTDPYLVRMMVFENASLQYHQKNWRVYDPDPSLQRAMPSSGEDAYNEILHQMCISSMLTMDGNPWELSYAMSAMTCGSANTYIASQPSKPSSGKKIQFTNTLTKSASQTNIYHTLTDMSRRLRLHISHFPRVLPMLLQHMCEEPASVVTYGLTFADIEKLVQVYGKWETARPKIGSKSNTTCSTTTKVVSKSKPATKAPKAPKVPTHTTTTNGDPDDATDTTTIQSDELSNTTDKVSSNVSPTIRITARLKKQWKQLLQQQDDVVVACCT